MRYLILISCVLLFACSGEEENLIPEDVIQKEAFIALMTDIQLLEATFNQRMIREDDPRKKMPVYYEQVFEKHSVSKEDFEKSYEFWSGRTEDMKQIYESVINNLNKMEEEMNSRKNASEEETDMSDQ